MSENNALSIEVWKKLSTDPRKPVTQKIKPVPLDRTLEKPGVYAIWHGRDLIYIGKATKERLENTKSHLLRGLKDRLETQRRGRISGSVALALWFTEVAPSLSLKQHKAIAAGQKSPSKYTAEYIQAHFSYTCAPSRHPGMVESILCKQQDPKLNKFLDFMKRDTQLRRKQKG